MRSTVCPLLPIGGYGALAARRRSATVGNASMPATASKQKPNPRSGTAKAGAGTEPGVRPGPSGERHQNEGHGRRLTMAFEALEAFPALAESRNRLLTVVNKDHVATAEVVTAVESDVALIIAVLRLANQAPGARGRVDTVVEAVELLTPQTVQALAARVRTF